MEKMKGIRQGKSGQRKIWQVMVKTFCSHGTFEIAQAKASRMKTDMSLFLARYKIQAAPAMFEEPR